MSHSCTQVATPTCRSPAVSAMTQFSASASQTSVRPQSSQRRSLGGTMRTMLAGRSDGGFNAPPAAGVAATGSTGFDLVARSNVGACGRRSYRAAARGTTMGYHTFDVDRADALEDPTRFAYCSVDELLALIDAPAAIRVAEIGSGTGFFTDEIAPYVDAVVAVDVQPAMHARYSGKGVPPNVAPVTAEAADLPFVGGAVDSVVSTFTYHEFASADALGELHRVLAPGGRVGVVDWSAVGRGESGPPLSQRFTADDAVDAFEAAGFAVTCAAERRETFVVAARRD